MNKGAPTKPSVLQNQLMHEISGVGNDGIFWECQGRSEPVVLSTEQETAERRVKAKLWKDRAETPQSIERWAVDLVHNQLAGRPNISVLPKVRQPFRAGLQRFYGASDLLP